MMTDLVIPERALAPKPTEVKTYLRVQGWTYVRGDDYWSVYQHDFAGQNIQIEVPEKEFAPDYSRAVQHLLNDLARLYSRQAASLLRDIRSSALDIVRLSIAGRGTQDGRISVEAGRRVYDAARELFVSAACTVLEPQKAFPKRQPEHVTKLLEEAKFGQTEYGSFILSIECAVPLKLQTALPDLHRLVDAPFERKTCLSLLQGLVATEKAARESVAVGMKAFEEQIDVGVSANLCEAVADLLESTDADRLDASFSFGAAWPQPELERREAHFSKHHITTLRQAGQQMRNHAVFAGVELIGPIIKLSSPESSQGGEAVMFADFEEKNIKVSMQLDARAYEQAIAAHKEGWTMATRGNLAREGRGWVLRELGVFEVRECGGE